MSVGAMPFQHLFRRGAAEGPPLLLHAETAADRIFAADWLARTP
ncbi:hypothetical protein [Inquilinus sp. OTU3971]